MFDLPLGPRHRRCDGRSRRDFLRVGGLTALGLTLPQLLRAEDSAAKRKPARAKSVILIFLSGGLTHVDTFDPKPDAPPEVRGKYQAIDTAAPGVKVGELLTLTARNMDKIALVRSVTHTNDQHEAATNWMLSGRPSTPAGDHPAIGAVVAHQTGFGGSLPPYVAVPQLPGFQFELGRSAYLGGRYEAFKTGDPSASNFRVADVAPLEPLDAKRANRRRTLLDAVDGLARKVEGNDQLATYGELHARATAMTLSGEARSAFSLDGEPDRVRDRYGRTTFGQSCLLARRLVERGVRFVTVTSSGWDHHQQIWQNLERMLPDLDRGFSALVEDAAGRGLLAETLVLIMGEFGRTPRLNGMTGRDHWGAAASLVAAGAGVRGGAVIGATDRQGGYVTNRPVAPADVAATVLDALGIDPRGRLTAPDGRPVEILDQGEPVRELFA
jgi:uncharacterized protein (DUF1501 family)